jgi:hypothetical protein
MGKRVAILQSNYLPWPGYFDIIGSVDEFVLFDVVQYTKNDWRNRNRIKTPDGVRWLTIPVATAGRFGQSIAEARVTDGNWAVQHWRTVSQAYARAAHFDRYAERLADAYRACGDMPFLAHINRAFITTIAAELGLDTVIRDTPPHKGDSGRNERLVDLCLSLGADVYVSGPSATYLDVGMFQDHGVAVEFMEYPAYGPYPQLHGPFAPGLSVIDLLFAVGPEARGFLSCARRRP